MRFTNVKTELCDIMNKFGSDKGNHVHHNYTTLYDNLFSKMRGEKIRIFELGLGTNNPLIPSNMGVNGKPGASLRGWAEYFPQGQIFGADIDRDILFSEDRIETYYCDQRDSSSIKLMWSFPSLSGEFDIIIEDGLHECYANVIFFENSIYKLKKGGYYIIEDVIIEDLQYYYPKINEWSRTYPQIKFNVVTGASPSNNNSDNCVIVAYRSV